MKMCARCGIRREVNDSRVASDVCIDCRLVESDLAAMACPLGYASHYGYKRHKALGEYPCDACRHVVVSAGQRYRRRKGMPPMRPAECGTLSGRSCHARRGEEPCGPCKEAQAVYAREWRARKREVA